MDDQITELALWERAKRGDPEAFGAVFDKHSDRVFRHSFRLLLDREDAEDATAAAFMELWRRRTHVRVVAGTVLPWILVTATNTSRNIGRARRRYRRLLADLPREQAVPSAEDLVLEDSISAELSTALASLSPRDAQLLALVALEDYSVAVAASTIGISPAAARTRLHRLRHRLKEHLRQVPLDSHLTREAT